MTITQNTADTPQASLHNYGTIKQITADVSQTSLQSRVYVMKFEVCQECFMLLTVFM
jgi:hypothetical protein